MANKRTNKLSDQMRAAINASELTRYRIAVDAELDHGTLSRFMSCKGGLSIDVLDRLGDVLGLELVKRRRPKRKGR